jgi:hypothetical protein
VVNTDEQQVVEYRADVEGPMQEQLEKDPREEVT